MLRILHLIVSLVTVAGFQFPHTRGARRASQLLPLLVAKEPATKNNNINLEQQALPLASPNDDSSAFQLLSDLAEACMLKSDIQRDAVVVDPKNVGKFQQASSASNWIHEPSAFALQQALNQVQLQYYSKNTASKSTSEDNDKATQQDAIARREEAGSWIRWMKSVPSPAIVDLTSDLHNLLDTNSTVLKLLDQKPDEFKSRLFCRLLLFPSGLALDGPLVEPPNSIVYGKLLYGGVTRYRSLESSTGTSAHVNSKRDGARRAGERTAMQAHAPCWLMFGGAKRMYQAVDVGPAAVLELGLLPRKRELIVPVSSDETYVATPPGMVMIRNVPWSPHEMFGFVNEHEEQVNGEDTNELDDIASAASMSGMKRNQAFQSDFESSVGGLSLQINAIVRRVLDGRVMRPADEGSIQTKGGEEWDSTTQQLATASLEAAELKLLGLEPVRGLLLYGPPGCGKTALAREISRALKARTPKIVAAPELLDRWVGGSEKAVRALFAEAEQELAVCGGDATRSALHVIVIDEIDAVFRKRSSAEDTGESTRSSVVNQILSKLDGINAIPNVLLIGMTNRRELLDEALLRPGRLEVQIEIPLPDKEGRREIFQIHFGPLRRNGRLSQPLCRAIDGKLPLSDMPSMYMRKRDYVKRKLRDVVELIPSISGGTYDLAADSVTGGFSGADIAGLVRCAGSIALARARIDGSGITGMLITLEDVKQALAEV